MLSEKSIFINSIRFLKVIIIFLLFTMPLVAQTKEEVFKSDKVATYKSKFKESNLYETITNNFGDNCPSVYGTRNMRVVLNGLVYRGGANNVYNKNNKRDNKNPLPEEGLENLLNEGFSTAVYLYKTNFSTSKKIIGSDTNKNKLKYIQNSLSNDKEIRELLELVYQNMFDSTAGPIYIHCWNGWHQSGYASALILMQFCNFSNKEALEYWEKCASGNLDNYNHIKKAILKFKPYTDLIIKSELKKLICPC